jgi:hypothetical protein
MRVRTASISAEKNSLISNTQGLGGLASQPSFHGASAAVLGGGYNVTG